MNVLVTGGAGYIGSVVTRQLLAVGHHVRVLDSLMHTGSALVPYWAEPGFELVKGDVRDAQLVGDAIKGIDAVVHLAAIVGDPACARQPDVAKTINHDASLQLFDQSRAAGVEKFVFASTCSNYGRMADPTTYVDESSDLRPISVYAETKVAVERALLASQNNGSPIVTVLRLATAYGISPRMRFDLTVNEFTMELLTRGKVVIFGEQFWRPYVHVRDVARVVSQVLEAPPAQVGGMVFNVGSTSENYQKGRLAEVVAAELGAGHIERVTRTEDPRDYRVSFERIRTTLGFTPSRTVQAGVREIAAAIQHGVLTDLDNPRYRN